MPLAQVSSVWKSYPRRAGLRTKLKTVVEDVSIAIESGETLGLVGESVTGKTTLARLKVLEIVAEPLLIHRRDAGLDLGSGPRNHRAVLRSKAIELLNEVGLEAGLDESALARQLIAATPELPAGAA
jgi:ABC-type glutathione transport system ATPase component